MPGKSPSERASLAALNARLLEGFEAAGYAFITPEIIQPADVFLERAGEDIRSRTYVFTDPDGNELCLRPDLTVPTCRYHLEHTATPCEEARYCYSGPAFRHQPGGHKGPREFDQAGLELFGAPDSRKADAEILNLTISALEKAGLKNYTLRLGDLGLFHALLDSIDMPERWRRRLMHHFWRPMAFHRLLNNLTGKGPKPQTSISELVDRIEVAGVEATRSVVEEVLDERSLSLVPGRTVDDIAGRLAEKAADRSEPRLAADGADLINAYLDVHGGLDEVHGRLAELAPRTGNCFSDAVKAMAERCELFDLAGMKNGSAGFAAEFGRSLEYYTGFVFQIEVPGSDGEPVAVAGGGRYDGMISDIGNCDPVPAVGCAIHTERLLALLEGGAS